MSPSAMASKTYLRPCDAYGFAYVEWRPIRDMHMRMRTTYVTRTTSTLASGTSTRRGAPSTTRTVARSRHGASRSRVI